MSASVIAKILVLICLGIGIHQTVKVNLHQGLYTIEYCAKPIPNMNKLQVHIDDSHIVIEGGCNTQSTTYWIQDESIRVGAWASTRMFCNEDHDSSITQIFEQATKISAYAGKAYLYDKQGVKLLKIRKMQ